MKRSAGFTIVELVIVIVVLAILVTMTIVTFNGVQAQSRDSKRISDALAIKEVLSRYYNANNEYPNVCPSGPEYACNTSYLVTALTPYTSSLPLTDPKGAAYQYVRATAYDSYGLYLGFEASPICKTGIKVSSGWWGAGVPICTNV